MANILGVGIATLDVINFVTHYPLEDEELRAQSQRITRGGNVTNTLCVLSQYKHQCTWAGVLCNDNDVNHIVDDLKKHQVDYSHCQLLSQGKIPTSYITINQQNGSRTIVHYRDLPELNFEHFQTIPLQDFEWIHFEARDVAENLRMINWVRKQFPRIIISVEIEKPRVGIEDIFAAADLYLFSKNFAQHTGYSKAKEFLQHQAYLQPKKDLVCAWGEQGAYALTSTQEFFHQPAYPVIKLIDTIGAGDTFNAGVIHARINNYSWKETLRHACELAAKKCGQTGFENLIESGSAATT